MRVQRGIITCLVSKIPMGFYARDVTVHEGGEGTICFFPIFASSSAPNVTEISYTRRKVEKLPYISDEWGQYLWYKCRRQTEPIRSICTHKFLAAFGQGIPLFHSFLNCFHPFEVSGAIRTQSAPNQSTQTHKNVEKKAGRKTEEDDYEASVVLQKPHEKFWDYHFRKVYLMS